MIGVLVSRDTDLMVQALTALGAVFQRVEGDPTVLDVTPIGLATTTGSITVESGLAGTVMRFIPGVAASTNATVFVDGDEQSYARPMGPVIDGLIRRCAHQRKWPGSGNESATNGSRTRKCTRRRGWY